MLRLACVVMLLAGCDVVFLEESDRSSAAACHPALADGPHIIEVPQPWAEAEAACESLQVPGSARHAHLVVVSDVAEDALLREIAGTDGLWIGLTDRRREGTFVTVTGEPGVEVFRADQPNGGVDQNCVALFADGMQDKSCAEIYRYACECDAEAPDATRF